MEIVPPVTVQLSCMEWMRHQKGLSGQIKELKAVASDPSNSDMVVVFLAASEKSFKCGYYIGLT